MYMSPQLQDSAPSKPLLPTAVLPAHLHSSPSFCERLFVLSGDGDGDGDGDGVGDDFYTLRRFHYQRIYTVKKIRTNLKRDQSLSLSINSNGSLFGFRRKMEAKKEEIRKGPWKAEEDEVLINHVKKYGPRDWSSIRSKGLLQRTGKSCRLRWVNKLRPNLKNGCKFSTEEERVVIELQAQFGNKWAKIATYLPGRTDNDVKNFWSSRQKRLARILHSAAPSSSKSLKVKRDILAFHYVPSVEVSRQNHHHTLLFSSKFLIQMGIEKLIFACGILLIWFNLVLAVFFWPELVLYILTSFPVENFKAPTFSSSMEEESSSKVQSCSSSYVENPEAVRTMPLPEMVKPDLFSFDINHFQLELNPTEKDMFIESQSQVSFPQIPQPQSGLEFSPESQELLSRLQDPYFLDMFGQAHAPELGNGSQLSLGPPFYDPVVSCTSAAGAAAMDGSSNHPATPFTFFDDFPVDVFDQIEKLPCPSDW
ncbi:LOW QUALITY PROTEIN: transcription factor DUO1 [Tripterygium wilfordii]|uniref:LOW QUALITY PROTEIN: transcription factor DUO1 n=1 Tax=Tripterygium wilfordii TaxID=458696 RepID=UPI0018F7F89B|nr:LOW QUALITY PROTEIN: transcription factor DUO1 [Tripterygium wilfordii]